MFMSHAYSKSGLENTSENFDISSIIFFSIYANNFCDAGQVPILRYFEVFKCPKISYILLFFFSIKMMVIRA